MNNPHDASSRQKHLVLSSDLAELDRVVEEAQAFARGHTSDEDLVYRIVLLTTEAVTNAVEHGNRLDPSKRVRVDFEATDAHIEVRVEDEGEGFDPHMVKNPLAEENLLHEGGRGIFLIESLADEHVFDLDGRRLRMVFRYPD